MRIKIMFFLSIMLIFVSCTKLAISRPMSHRIDYYLIIQIGLVREVTTVQAGMYPTGSFNNPCPVISKSQRFAGLDIGVGLRFVGQVYARGYTQNDKEGYRYWGGRGGTPGIGIWPKGISLGFPIDIQSERSIPDCNVEMSSFNQVMDADNSKNQVTVIRRSNYFLAQNMPINMPSTMPIYSGFFV